MAYQPAIDATCNDLESTIVEIKMAYQPDLEDFELNYIYNSRN